MSNKFRTKGRHSTQDFEDEWLDNQDTLKKGSRRPANRAPEPEWLEPAETNGVVIEIYPKLCMVVVDERSDPILCSYRRALVFKPGERGTNQDGRDRSPVAVGDRVKVRLNSPKEGVVEGIARRQNYLTRSAPGRSQNLYHTIAANIDLMVIVSAAEEPSFSAGLIDRFLAAAVVGGLSPVLVINKIDLAPSTAGLADSVDSNGAPWLFYQRELEIPVIEVSAKKQLGLKALLDKIIGRRVVFVGHSGVGKTTLLRQVLQREIGKTSEVNRHTGKGKHTTTSAALFFDEQGSQWIDTPGVRSFEPVIESVNELRDFFPEFRKVNCKMAGCYHLEEAGCAVRSLTRYESYVQFYHSLKDVESEDG